MRTVLLARRLTRLWTTAGVPGNIDGAGPGSHVSPLAKWPGPLPDAVRIATDDVFRNPGRPSGWSTLLPTSSASVFFLYAGLWISTNHNPDRKNQQPGQGSNSVKTRRSSLPVALRGNSSMKTTSRGTL
jgi:hypothetical protein